MLFRSAELVKRVNVVLSVRSSVFSVEDRNAPVLNTQPSTLNPETLWPWRIGQNVLHPKFGAGVIVSAEGRGSDARVQVNFHKAGVKWLMLEYAKLTPA